MNTETKKSISDNFLTVLFAVIFYGFFGFLIYASTRDEKVAEWKETCEIVSINETVKKIITNAGETNKHSAVADIKCNLGPIMGKRIFVKEFNDESSVNIQVGEKFICSFEAWEVVNPGSIAGPGPITRDSQLKFKGCNKKE